MSPRARIAIVAAAVVVLVVAFVIARGGDDDNGSSAADTTSTPAAQAPASTATTAPDAGSTQTATATPEPPEPEVPLITVTGGKPAGGEVERITFTKGDTIRFRVQSDAAAEIHFHGYDVAKDVRPGGSVTFSVKATIEGRFEVEVEDTGTQIAEVEVDPS